MHSQYCTTINTVTFQNILSPPKYVSYINSCSLIPSSLFSSSLKPLLLYILSNLSLIILNVLYKRDLQIWPLWLDFFQLLCSVFRFIQVVAMLVLHSFYNRIIFHCINMPHFVYPFISWQTLDCFHFLAIVNKAVMNICVNLFCLNMSLILWVLKSKLY